MHMFNFFNRHNDATVKDKMKRISLNVLRFTRMKIRLQLLCSAVDK